MANNITLSYPSAFYHQFLDKNGKPLTGGKLYTYSAGTSTSIPTYKTIGDTSSANTNTNPIILDNAGVAHIVIETDKAYKFVLFDKNDSKIDEWDNVTGNIGGGGGGSEDIVVVGTPNEIDVSGSVIQGVKRYVVSLSNSVKITILQLIGLYNNVLNSLGNKADKVQGATAGNFAALDANGNLTDSGSKSADFKTKQTPVADPSASGNGLEFIDSISQNANGEITPHKKSVQDGTTEQKGVVKLSNAIDSTSVTEAATPKAVKDAYDELNNKIVARATFLSQAEWAVQSQLPGDPAKVYYVENGTGEDAYTVYVWRESTSTYEEVDESSIDLDGYWHDGPTTTGNGNVVTNITLGNDGVPQVEKGLTALTQHQSVTDNDPTLAWSTRSKVGTIGGTDLHVTMPSNPASGKLDSTGDASNTTSTFTKASGDTSSMTSGSKLSAIFTAISSFFASLKALAFKDKASYNDLSSGVQSSLDKADSALQSHQSVTDNNPTLAWSTTSKVGKVGSTDLQVTMPSNPAADKQGERLMIYGNTNKFVKLFQVYKFTDGSTIGTTVELIGRAGGTAVRVVINIKSPITADYIQFYDYNGDTSHYFTLYVAQDPDDSSKNLVYAFLAKYGSLYVNAADTSAGDTDLNFSVFGDAMSGRISGDTAITLRNMKDASWINSGTFDAARIPTSLPNVTAGAASAAASESALDTAINMKASITLGNVYGIRPSTLNISGLTGNTWYNLFDISIRTYTSIPVAIKIQGRNLGLFTLFIRWPHSLSSTPTQFSIDSPNYTDVGYTADPNNSMLFHIWLKTPVGLNTLSAVYESVDSGASPAVADGTLTATSTEPTNLVRPSYSYPIVARGGKGSPSTPVYVDSDGQVQPCNPSQIGVGAASYAEAVNLAKNSDSTNGDYIYVGSGTGQRIGNAGNAKTWDGHAISIGSVSSSAGTISIV